MGRKIPGRKHKGVRDPEKQRIKRQNSIKDKINAPPVNEDEQHIPKSLTRFIELKNKFKDGGMKKQKKEKKPKKHRFERLPGEKDREFLNRINQECANVKKEAAFEEKYGVKIVKNQDTGEVEKVVKRPKDELELHIQKLRAEKHGKKKKRKPETDEPKLTKSQKRQKKLKERKLQKQLNKGENFEVVRDNVKFGETVHAPPSLAAPRKVDKEQCAPRPGKKQLLLKSLLQNNNNSETTKENTETNFVSKVAKKLKQTANKVIDRKGKRRDLPHALRRQLDKQQKEIIQAYKDMKAKRYTST